MSYAEAISRSRSLRESLLDHGVRKVSIELVPGRSGSGWSSNYFVASLGHHIVSRPSQGDTPFLHLVKKGRVDVPGPLCNGYGGFDRVARIICMGWANHPGYGGPMWVPAGTIPKNNGRPYLFGWEMEGGIEPWVDEMHEFMAQCFAGTLDWLGQPTRAHGEHKTWAPTRKVDRLGYTAESARAMIDEITGDDDMPDPRISDDVAQTMNEIHNAIEARRSNGTSVGLWIDAVYKLRDFGLDPEEAATIIGNLSRLDIPGGRRGWDAWASNVRKYAQAAGWLSSSSNPDSLITTERQAAFMMRMMQDANPQRHREIRQKAGLD